ncbi:hypothetical protein E4K72_02960 [Oxalobacteraceae bacterium OM1]|nr:hypothetical protein E4K72_02960 [Oxalobacteraceae bacterium OM1]
MTSKFEPEVCPICGKGQLMPYSDGLYEFKHARKSIKVPNQHYARCNECGTRAYLPGQRAANMAAIREQQAKLPDYVSPSDVLAVREKYCLTQKEANAIFGGGSQGFSKWERGLAVPAGPTARLIKLALGSPAALVDLARIANVKLTTLEDRELENRANDLASESKPKVVVYECTHLEQFTSLETDIESESIYPWTQKTPNAPFQYRN